MQAHALGDPHRLVAGDVVHEDHVIHEIVRDVCVGPLQGERSVVCGHDDDDSMPDG